MNSPSPQNGRGESPAAVRFCSDESWHLCWVAFHHGRGDLVKVDRVALNDCLACGGDGVPAGLISGKVRAGQKFVTVDRMKLFDFLRGHAGSCAAEVQKRVP